MVDDPRARERLCGWGRYPAIEAATARGEDLERLSRGAPLSRGLGRAYGDSALPVAGDRRPLAVTPLADRILSFDESTGVLRAEAGLSLGTLREVLLPRRWFTPVSPGTRYVTLGGMVAAWLEYALLKRRVTAQLPRARRLRQPAWRYLPAAGVSGALGIIATIALDGFPPLLAAPIALAVTGVVYVMICARAGSSSARLLLRAARLG